MTLDSRHERRLTCISCGATITVGGYIDDLDPDTFRGVVCGCRKPIEAHAVELRHAIDRARAAATGHGIPYQQEA